MQTLQAPHLRVSDSKGTTPITPNIWNAFSTRYHNAFSEHCYRTLSSLPTSLNAKCGAESRALPYPVTLDHPTASKSHSSLPSHEAPPSSVIPQVLPQAPTCTSGTELTSSPWAHRTRRNEHSPAPPAALPPFPRASLVAPLVASKVNPLSKADPPL